jgi:hypothetical protein
MRFDHERRHEFYRHHRDGLLNTSFVMTLGSIPAGLLVEFVTDSAKLGVGVMSGALAIGVTCLEGAISTYSLEDQTAIYVDAFGDDIPGLEGGQTD